MELRRKIVIEKSTAALAPPNPAARIQAATTVDQLVAETLMIAFTVVMSHELRQRPHDLQIAAVALRHDLTLVTHNSREFSRIAALRLEDWE
jgi:predicted nucleic acid-binding protein